MAWNRFLCAVITLAMLGIPSSGCIGEDAAPNSDDDPLPHDASQTSPEDGAPASDTTWESDNVSGEVAGAAATNVHGGDENGKSFRVFQNASTAIINVTLDGAGEIVVNLFEPGTDACIDPEHSKETEDQHATFKIDDPPTGSWSICVYSEYLGAAHGTWTLTAESKVII